MTAYEILLMLDPELAEDRGSEIVARIRELVDGGGGTWRSHDPWGRRRLAYEIDHKGEGVYHLVVFESSAEALDEITRVLKITDGVMRHLAVRHIEGSRTSAPRDEPFRDDSRDERGGRREDIPERAYAGSSSRSPSESAPDDADSGREAREEEE